MRAARRGGDWSDGNLVSRSNGLRNPFVRLADPEVATVDRAAPIHCEQHVECPPARQKDPRSLELRQIELHFRPHGVQSPNRSSCTKRRCPTSQPGGITGPLRRPSPCPSSWSIAFTSSRTSADVASPL